jgi:hypothetical protein
MRDEGDCHCVASNRCRSSTSWLDTASEPAEDEDDEAAYGDYLLNDAPAREVTSDDEPSEDSESSYGDYDSQQVDGKEVHPGDDGFGVVTFLRTVQSLILVG